VSSEFELKPPLGHESWLQGLWRAAAQDRLPHGLLLLGPAGIGKFTALRWFAAGLFCSEGPGTPCLACGPCRRLAAGTHADLWVVDAVASGEDVLTIGFIAQREKAATTGYKGPAVADFLELKAREGGWRIVLVREAERMNEAAQNAFLKTLEEPGQQTLIALETAWPSRLLDTIRSRVVVVETQAPPRADALEVLLQAGIQGVDAVDLLRRSKGSPGAALASAREGGPAMLELLGQYFAGRPAAEVRRNLWELDGEFDGKTPAAQSRTRASLFLDLGLAVLLDAERLAAGARAEDLAFGDVAASIAPLGEQERRRRLAPWLEARQDVPIHLAPDGLVDRALMGHAPLSPAPLSPAPR
jgi:hypothetical protein